MKRVQVTPPTPPKSSCAPASSVVVAQDHFQLLRCQRCRLLDHKGRERISGFGTYETYGLGEVASAFEVKPDIGPPLAEVRV
jgi:hypothetical protein